MKWGRASAGWWSNRDYSKSSLETEELRRDRALPLLNKTRDFKQGTGHQILKTDWDYIFAILDTNRLCGTRRTPTGLSLMTGFRAGWGFPDAQPRCDSHKQMELGTRFYLNVFNPNFKPGVKTGLCTTELLRLTERFDSCSRPFRPLKHKAAKIIPPPRTKRVTLDYSARCPLALSKLPYDISTPLQRLLYIFTNILLYMCI